MGRLPPRCMWPVEPGTLRVPASGRKHMMSTIRICGQKAKWKILRGDERTYVCDRCKAAAIRTYDDECVVEPYPEDQVGAD